MTPNFPMPGYANNPRASFRFRSSLQPDYGERPEAAVTSPDSPVEGLIDSLLRSNSRTLRGGRHDDRVESVVREESSASVRRWKAANVGGFAARPGCIEPDEPCRVAGEPNEQAFGYTTGTVLASLITLSDGKYLG